LMRRRKRKAHRKAAALGESGGDHGKAGRKLERPKRWCAAIRAPAARLRGGDGSSRADEVRAAARQAHPRKTTNAVLHRDGDAKRGDTRPFENAEAAQLVRNGATARHRLWRSADLPTLLARHVKTTRNERAPPLAEVVTAIRHRYDGPRGGSGSRRPPRISRTRWLAKRRLCGRQTATRVQNQPLTAEDLQCALRCFALLIGGQTSRCRGACLGVRGR
jgi:hypothetical protein